MSKERYDWESDAPPLLCPHCGETAMPLRGANRYECYGCGEIWRVGGKTHALAVQGYCAEHYRKFPCQFCSN